MDYFDAEFQFQDIPSIAPDLMFAEDPSSPVREPKILTQHDRDVILKFVFDDHSYSKPYPVLSTGNNKCLTPRTILKLQARSHSQKKKYKKKVVKHLIPDSDDDIDVVSIDKPDDLLIRYDVSKARHVMNEVEAYLNSLWKDVQKDDEEKIVRGSWSKEQARLFDTTYKVIYNYQLAKLAYAKNVNEPVLRKLALDKATKRFRKAFGSVMWNPKFVVWLHGIMIDGLGSSLFLCYLEVLQSLKRKVPTLFERVLLSNKGASEKELSAGLPHLGARLRKSWEPSLGLHTKVTMEKFPTLPFLITIPSGPNVPHQSTKRNRFWNNQLMNFGKAVPISVPAYRTPEGYVIKYYLEHCISAVRGKIAEFRNRFPDRHVVLIGWGVGSLVACKVATLDKVDSVVCLGFPCNGIDGQTSHEYWTALAKIECPVLFVIGTHALTNSVDGTEELRGKMKTQTNLIVMESADELLRLTKSQKRTLRMTQNMIDKLIQDEIYLFLKSVLFKPKPAVCSPFVKGNHPSKKRKKKLEGSEVGEVKKKKKNMKTTSMLSVKTSDNSYILQPRDVSVLPAAATSQDSQGLLTTGSISTTIPVTQLQSESLISANVRVVGSNVTSSELITAHLKTTQKRSLKEKGTKKVKTSKKLSSNKAAHALANSQKFTANLGTQRSGNLSGQRFSSGELGFIATSNSRQQEVTLQRVPSGSFVLSGASGHVRLQGGTNIVYLQQATSGATQLIQTPLIANSSGAFTAVFSSSTTGTSPSLLNLVQQSSNTSQGGGPKTTIYLQKGKASGASNFAANNAPSSSDMSVAITAVNTPIVESDQIDASRTVTSLASCSDVENVASSTTNTSVSGANTTTSTIMTHLSANDLRYLASLIAKHSSSLPTSPLSATATAVTYTKLSVENVKSPKATKGNSIPARTIGALSSPTETIVPVTSKSALVSVLDKKMSLVAGNQGLKKITYPSSLAQNVTAVQLKDGTKVKPPPLKSPRIPTTAASFVRGSVTATSMSPTRIMASISSTPKSARKVPVTLTIPISRLPANLNLTSPSTTSKGISVPALSAYLAQQKFVLSTTKASSHPNSRTVLISPSVGKKTSVATSNNKSKISNASVFVTTSFSNTNLANVTLKKSSIASSALSSKATGKGTATITLHLPTQAVLKDPNVLRKAASDIKLVGILNQQSKLDKPPVNLSSLRPDSALGSPTQTPPDDDMSLIQPRKSEEAEDIRSRDNIVPIKYLVGPKSTIETLKVSTSASGNTVPPVFLSSDRFKPPTYSCNDESDVDFAVNSNSTKSSYVANKPVAMDTSKHVINVAKLLHATPVGVIPRGMKNAQATYSGIADGKGISRSFIELAKARMQDTGSRVDTKKSFSPKLTETASEGASQTATSDAKLKFEPLKVTGSRSNLTSVLSSMRETGKIVVDENGITRTTIVAKPTKVSSKAAALIAKTAFLTSSAISVSQNKNTTTTTITAGMSNSKSSLTTTTTTTIKSMCSALSGTVAKSTMPVSTKLISIVPKKVLPVSVKANDVICMATPSRVNNVNNPHPSPVKTITIEKPITDKKTLGDVKRAKLIEEKEEENEEPVPYVTRSGRVLRNRYSYADELDKNVTRKRRRTISSSKEDAPAAKQVPSTPSTIDSSQCSTLDSLVEAAKLMKDDVNSFVNGDVTTPKLTINENAADVDTSGANIAATAMLELLTSESKQIMTNSTTAKLSVNIEKDTNVEPRIDVVAMTVDENSGNIKVETSRKDMTVSENGKSDNEQIQGEE